MTIRENDLMDQYAGMAMAGLLINEEAPSPIGCGREMERKSMVQDAWEIAKMMMEQRDITYAKIKDSRTDYLKDE